MPTRAARACRRHGLHRNTECPTCRTERMQTADRQRPGARARGYNRDHEQRFRQAVLQRDPVCVICHNEPATVADHWPKSKRELEAEGLDSSDPKHGRGLGHGCHSRATNRNQPGGFLA